jgi:hypothetical protein
LSGEDTESLVQYAPEFRPLHRFMDDLRNFATRGFETPLSHLKTYTLDTLNKQMWIELRHEWRTKFKIATSPEWETAVGAVHLGLLRGIPLAERDAMMEAMQVDDISGRLMAFSDVILFFPVEDYEEYLKGGTASMLSEVYSLAASACLSLMKLEVEGKHIMGPVFRGDANALSLLQSFRDGMTTRHFMKRYAPRARSIQLQPSLAVPVTSRTD